MSETQVAGFTPEELREIAVKVSSEAAAFLRDMSYKPDNELSKVISGETTRIDLDAENFIIESLKREIGDLSIVTEEQGVIGNGEITAVVDPLDGSKNYLNKIPWASVSIAFLKTGEKIRNTIAGAVSPIFYGDPISFARGNGCFIGEARVERRDPPERFIYVYIEHPDSALMVASLIGELGRGYKIRSLGSAALEISYTGIGRGTAFFDFRSKLRNVDIAAASGILLECGGELLAYDGSPLDVAADRVRRAGTVVAVAKKEFINPVRRVLSRK